MTNPLKSFIASSPANIIDVVREEAARCCEETARCERGERGPLRQPTGLIAGEFSDAAFGVAAEVAMTVAEAIKASGARFEPAFCWSTAATLLRNGWQRGHRLVGHVLRKDAAS